MQTHRSRDRRTRVSARKAKHNFGSWLSIFGKYFIINGLYGESSPWEVCPLRPKRPWNRQTCRFKPRECANRVFRFSGRGDSGMRNNALDAGPKSKETWGTDSGLLSRPGSELLAYWAGPAARRRRGYLHRPT